MSPTRLCRIVVLALASSGAGGQPVFDSVGRAEGLPSDYVLSILQDRAGFLWFGTDAGLARWDGQTAVVFTPDDGLPHAYVYALAEDGDGTLWAGTRRGLARRDGRRFRTVRTPLGSVDRLVVDARGRLVALSRGAGLVVRREPSGRWRSWRAPDGVGDAVPLPDGRLLVSTHPDLPNGTFQTLPADGPLRPRPVRSPPGVGWRLWPAPQGRVLVATGRRASLARVVEDRLVVESGVTGPVMEGGLSTALVARDGGVLLSGYGDGGVWRGVPGGGPTTPLLPHRAEALAEDYEGGVWIGTFGQGAFRLRARHLTTLWPGPTLRLARGHGAVWATSDRLLRVEPGSGGVRAGSGLPLLRAVAVDAEGRVRVSGGALLYAPVRSERGPWAAEAHDASWISGLLAVRDTLWVGTYGDGLLRFALRPDGRVGRALDTLSVGRGLPTDVVEDVLLAGGGAWLLTREVGALRVRGRRVEPFGRAQGLPSSSVFSVLEQTDGTLWFGTDRGIARLRRGRVVGLGRAALGGRRVVALFERPATPGALWAVADGALVRIDGDRVRVLGGFPLVPDPKASVHAATYDAGTDALFLATTRGLVRADLGAVPEAGPPPRVALVEARVDARGVALGGPPAAGTLADLPPGRHRVEVDVAPLSFAGSRHVEVRWDGGPWRPSASRTAALAGVGAGRHTFEVRAVSADGVRSARPATLTFRVRPFWWERRPVQAGLALLLAGGLVAAGQAAGRRRVRRRLAAIEAERAAEHHVQAERERISRDLHDHVGGRLAALLTEVEAARMEGTPAAALAAVEAGAREAMDSLRETVWALHHESLTVEALAERVGRFARARAASLGVVVAVEVEGETTLTLSPDLALHLYRITQEAVTNALRHAAARTVTVALHVRDGRLTLTVADDGRFRTCGGPEPPDEVPGGFGMRTMAARAEALGGTFTLGTDAGTTVRVEVPVSPPGGLPPRTRR